MFDNATYLGVNFWSTLILSKFYSWLGESSMLLSKDVFYPNEESKSRRWIDSLVAFKNQIAVPAWRELPGTSQKREPSG